MANLSRSARKALSKSLANITPMQLTKDSLPIPENILTLDNVIKMQTIYPEATLTSVQDWLKCLTSMKDTLKNADMLTEDTLDLYLGKTTLGGSNLENSLMGLIAIHLAMSGEYFIVLPDTLANKDPNWKEAIGNDKTVIWVDRNAFIDNPQDCEINMQKAADFYKLIATMPSMKVVRDMVRGKYSPRPNSMGNTYISTTVSLLPEEIPNLVGGKPKRGMIVGTVLTCEAFNPGVNQNRFVEYELRFSLRNTLAAMLEQQRNGRNPDEDLVEQLEDILESRFGVKYSRQWLAKIGTATGGGKDIFQEPKFHKKLGDTPAYYLTAANESDRDSIEQYFREEKILDNRQIKVKASEAALIEAIMDCLLEVENDGFHQKGEELNETMLRAFSELRLHHPEHSIEGESDLSDCPQGWLDRLPTVPPATAALFWPKANRDWTEPKGADMETGEASDTDCEENTTLRQHKEATMDAILLAGLEVYEALLDFSIVTLEEEEDIANGSFATAVRENWKKVVELYYPDAKHRGDYDIAPISRGAVSRARTGDWALHFTISTSPTAIDEWLALKETKEAAKNSDRDIDEQQAIADKRLIGVSSKTWNGTINVQMKDATIAAAMGDIIKLVGNARVSQPQMRRFKSSAASLGVQHAEYPTEAQKAETWTKMGIRAVSHQGKADMAAFKWLIELEPGPVSGVTVRARARLLVNFLTRGDVNTRAQIVTPKAETQNSASGMSNADLTGPPPPPPTTARRELPPSRPKKTIQAKPRKREIQDAPPGT
jgi:hypothetical protein